MKLYFSPAACSLSPHIVALEAGIALELENVDLGSKKTASGADYLKINPKGYVPALELDDGQLLTEGPAIVQYLADSKPGSKLAPANGSLERVRLQEMLNFISTEIHKQFTPLFKPTTTPELRQSQIELLSRRFDYIAQSLGDKPYLFGEQFSVADAYLFTVLNWGSFVKLDLAPWPKLQQYQARVAARPAVKDTLEAEGLLKKKA